MLRIAAEELFGIIIQRVRGMCQGKGTGQGKGDKTIGKEIAC